MWARAALAPRKPWKRARDFAYRKPLRWRAPRAGNVCGSACLAPRRRVPRTGRCVRSALRPPPPGANAVQAAPARRLSPHVPPFRFASATARDHAVFYCSPPAQSGRVALRRNDGRPDCPFGSPFAMILQETPTAPNPMRRAAALHAGTVERFIRKARH